MQSATDKSHDLIGEFGFIEGYVLGGDGEQVMVDSLFLSLPYKNLPRSGQVGYGSVWLVFTV